MSGDGTYVEYRGGGKDVPPQRIEHPPLTHNPHDPVHYYQGSDGRYYYTPDGNPHPEYGQPPVKQTIPPNQYQLKKPDTNGSWKHEADKGYKMHPDDLLDLANKLEQDVIDLRKAIVQDAQPKMNPAGAMGAGYPAAEDFDTLASDSLSVFTDRYNAIINTYEDVINRLRTTANNGKGGEQDTHHAVTQTGGHNKAI